MVYSRQCSDPIVTCLYASAAWSQDSEHRLSTPPQLPRGPLRVASLPLPLQVPWPTTKSAMLPVLSKPASMQLACQLSQSCCLLSALNAALVRCSPTSPHCRHPVCRIFLRAVAHSRPWMPVRSPAAGWAVGRGPPATVGARLSVPPNQEPCCCRQAGTDPVVSAPDKQAFFPPTQPST